MLSHQTHTNNVRIVSDKDRGTGIFKEPFTDVDGLITNTPGVALVTQYADCTPLLFFDPVKKVIATSHSGWRGTVKEIGKITVEKMQKECEKFPDAVVCASDNTAMGLIYKAQEWGYNIPEDLSSII